MKNKLLVGIIVLIIITAVLTTGCTKKEEDKPYVEIVKLPDKNTTITPPPKETNETPKDFNETTPKPDTDNDTEPTSNVHPLAKELPITERNFKVGTAGFVPTHWPNPTDRDWATLGDTIAEYGELYGVHTGWHENPDSEGIPQVVNIVYQITAKSNTKPYIAIGVEPDQLTQEEADNYFKENGQDFKNTAVKIAEKYHPEIMILGVEINRFYEKSPTGYEDFVTVYKETYDAIKEVSPNTEIGSNFQLEYMKGNAKVTGGNHEPHWQVIDMLGNKQDLVTFTTYPYFDYNTPTEIPEDYYTEIKDHTSKPIMITETGWPSKNVGSVKGSTELQIEYLKILLERTESLNLEALIWVFPHDINTGIAGGLFDSISLKENDGDEKPAFEYWEALQSLK